MRYIAHKIVMLQECDTLLKIAEKQNQNCYDIVQKKDAIVYDLRNIVDIKDSTIDQMELQVKYWNSKYNKSVTVKKWGAGIGGAAILLLLLKK